MLHQLLRSSTQIINNMQTLLRRCRGLFNFSTLAIAEHNTKTLSKGVSKLLRAASKLDKEVLL